MPIYDNMRHIYKSISYKEAKITTVSRKCLSSTNCIISMHSLPHRVIYCHISYTFKVYIRGFFDIFLKKMEKKCKREHYNNKEI